MVETVFCFRDHSQFLGVAFGNMDEGIGLLPGTKVFAFQSNERPTQTGSLQLAHNCCSRALNVDNII